MFRNNVKILIIVLALLCLLDLPYRYYQLFRIFGTIGLAYLAWNEYIAIIKFMTIKFGINAILFNPIIILSFNSDAWQAIEIIFAIIILIHLIFIKKLSKIENNK